MIYKVIKQKLQYFIHVIVQATRQRDPEVYATCHDPKIYPHTKFGIPTSNYIQICSGLDLASNETHVRIQRGDRVSGHPPLPPTEYSQKT